MNQTNLFDRIETLLEEAYNERMHLLTFMKMAEPGRFMKLMILGAQGVFYNGFFLSYLISPRICHRFVGFLEEEAVLTYTRMIADIDAGKLPKWEKLEAPEIAIRYWNMPEGHRSMRDLLLYIRADEAKHREVNHTLGNLEQNTDPNPFVSECQYCLACITVDRAKSLYRRGSKQAASNKEHRKHQAGRMGEERSDVRKKVSRLVFSDSAIQRLGVWAHFSPLSMQPDVQRQVSVK